MSTKSEIVVYRASYCKVFSASFRRMSFSTATGHNAQNPIERESGCTQEKAMTQALGLVNIEQTRGRTTK